MKITSKSRGGSYPVGPRTTHLNHIFTVFSLEPETQDDIEFLTFLNDPLSQMSKPAKKKGELLTVAISGYYTCSVEGIAPHLTEILKFELPKKYWKLISKQQKNTK